MSNNKARVKMLILINTHLVLYSILQNAVRELDGENQDGLPILFGFGPMKGFKINILRMSNACNIYGNGGTQIGSRCSTNVKSPSTEKAVFMLRLYIRDKRLSSLFLSSLCGPKHNVFLNAFLCPF